MADAADTHPDDVGPDLTDLARAFGVSTEYWDQAGHHRTVRRAVVAAVLRSLGADPSDDASVAASLAEHAERPWRRTLPPVFVTVAGSERTTWVHVPHGTAASAWIDLEGGGRRDLPQVDRYVEPRQVDGRLVGEATFAVPGDLPLGWHTLRAATDDGQAQAPLVVTPARLEPSALAGEHRFWGLMSQIYSLRSQRSWGIGDLADLADLATWSGYGLGADFVLVNPLHAASPVPPMAPSPYLPVTRRFPNPLYLRIEEIPEYGYVTGRDRKRIRSLGRDVRGVTADLLDRDAAWAAKRAALDIVRRLPLTPGRQAAYDAFVEREGTGLVNVATWFALADEYGPAWRDWPGGLQHPGSPEVLTWRSANADAVEWHLWTQWLLDEQLDRTQAAAQAAGMRIGVVHDLAVGVAFDGADAWALQDVLAPGVAVGAPPDMYNQMGQNWAQPPWRPDALAEAGFVPYRDMLRTILRHAGGLRIDHVLGLFRMWWVPEGMAAYDGTYVAFDHEALIGILALEAQRADAVVIGEDLGTVEPWVQDVLRDRGLLGTSILWFERWEGGALRLPEDWRRDVLASVTVHDLPPTAGYLLDEHVRIRAELGLLTRPIEQERAAADHERREWLDLLVARGLLDAGAADDVAGRVDDIVVALHRLMAQSPARLLGVALPDVVGDRRAQNQPGTDQEYPNWRVPLTDAGGAPVAAEDLPGQALAGTLAAVVRGQ